MPKFKTILDILNFAIAREEETYKFYMHLSNIVKDEKMKRVFEIFAKDELAHKALLMSLNEYFVQINISPVIDLKLDEFLVPDSDINKYTYQDALIIAIKNEKASYCLYKSLAEKKNLPHVFKDVLTNLAQDELRHKERFELEYDSLFMSEN